MTAVLSPALCDGSAQLPWGPHSESGPGSAVWDVNQSRYLEILLGVLSSCDAPVELGSLRGAFSTSSPQLSVCFVSFQPEHK